MTDQPQEPPRFLTHGPARPQIPVILAVPHSGRDYPPDLLAASRLPRSKLEALEDRYADLLVTDAVAAGATAMVAIRARAWIDLNRDEREIDPAMLDTPSPIPLIASAKVRGGIGLVPRRIADGGEIWRRRLSQREVDRRILEDHRPWHRGIATLLDQARARFGCAVLIDCHSMPPLPPTPYGQVAQLVVGDRFGRSAADRFGDRLCAVAEAAGLKVTRNAPYSGGHTLDRHGRPDRGIHALQLEIDRSLYLENDLRRPSSNATAITDLVGRIVAALTDEAISYPPALAAE
ncbi:N-formylglutamate amidohydrolase [Flavisphingomonas formosensis]|uniref:N-formylglutamate amidohydrolase n=1 Tax=Flavisphingomonas formosensis TaxID=861534 RepID=UPI0012FBDE79|nr:N-formylglutamate amidohydrolase [Sphingomonas formosensis]